MSTATACISLCVALACLPAMAPVLAAQGTSRGQVQGVVYDSVSRRPLAEATVQLLRVGSDSGMRTTAADSAGRFRFDSVAAGDWIVGAWHARLDSVGLTQLARPLRVTSGKLTQIRVAVPSAVSLIRRLCGDSTVRDSLGVVFGTIRRADRQRGAVAGVVRAQWSEVQIRGVSITQSTVGFDQPSGESGEYVACGVPTDTRFQIQASAGADSSGLLDVPAEASGLRRLDIFVASAQRRADTALVRVEDSTGVLVDTIITAYRRGTGRLTGRMARSGVPFPGVIASMWGTGLEVRSDQAGVYSLLGLPLGTHTVEMRAVGYEPIRRIVDVLPDDVSAIAVDLVRVTTLDTLRIRAWAMRDQGPFKEAEFLRRKRRGGGVFLSPDDLNRENPATMSQLFARAVFVRVQWGVAAGESLTIGSGLRRCTPAFLIDGRESGEDDFFMLVRPDNLLALEVYRGNATPIELAVPNPCGAIVVWTGRRTPPPERR
ncbi:carboxypeptidase-like regulatory domain-containing protein [Gemmatimonas sp.]|uniref:carboxypeptidase-like regulatory domain-containing protein n=1 Tax=Gemmatimonas sp. TaxID=1962908 RepID=UPI00333FB842